MFKNRSTLQKGYFLTAIGVYAAIVVFLSFLTDYRQAICGLFTLSALTTFIALYALLKP